jgi:toxin ParE1/3/4
MLKRFPYSGSRTDTEPVRKVVVRRYPYIVYYVVDTERRELVIVTIQHGARNQPFESDD